MCGSGRRGVSVAMHCSLACRLLVVQRIADGLEAGQKTAQLSCFYLFTDSQGHTLTLRHNLEIKHVCLVSPRDQR